LGAAAIGGAVVSAAVAAPLYLNQTSKDSQINSLQSQLTQAQQQSKDLQQAADLSKGIVTGLTGFLTLNVKQQAQVDAVADTMIPADSNGPGAREAGVIYFIDRQLAGSYGKNGNMYMQGPFVQPNQKGPITVGGITYSGGSAPARTSAGTGFQYALTLREYWRRGLQFLDDYSNSAYGASFETLNSDKRTQILNDMFDNKPTNFTGPTAVEFVSELHDMVVAGFYADPLYGGNRNMIGWKLAGAGGVNSGSFDNLDVKKLMVDSKPTRLTPVGLAQLRQLPQGGA